MATYNISIISPFPVVSIGLEKILKEEKEFDISGVANDYEGAMQLVRKGQDIIVAGISPGVWGGPLFIEDIRKKASSPILVCSESDDFLYANACLKAGALGYVLASESSHQIVQVVYSVLQGKGYFSEGVPEIEMVDEYIGLEKILTKTELVVFKLMGCGKGNPEIAKALNREEGTVKTHKRNIGRKLQYNDMKEVTECAFQYVLRKAIAMARNSEI